MAANTVIVPLRLTTVTFPDFHPLAGQSGPVYGFLIAHDEGLVLADTGVGHDNSFIDEFYRPVHESLSGQIAATGASLEDITAVVNGHLHFDHAGQNSCFPGVPIFIQRAEWELLEAGSYTVDEWIRFDGSDYRLIDGEAEVLPGIRVVPTPGHTAGHQAVVVDTSDGPAVIAGQVPYDADEFEHVFSTRTLPDVHGGQADPDRYLASTRSLIELRPSVVYFAHSDEPWRPAT